MRPRATSTESRSQLLTVRLDRRGGRICEAGARDRCQRMHTDVLATLSDAMGVPVMTIGGQNVSVIQEVKG